MNSPTPTLPGREGAQIKDLMQQTANQVKSAINWTDQQYADFQFEQGYEYLKYWIGEDVFGYRELPLTVSFWAWWRNHWHKRDEAFLDASKPMSVNERRKYYTHIHSPEAIAYRPQSVIMEEAYAQMIHEVTHKEEAK